jgi:enamine deaminase RidA (YjgF/YER057c/UK114 family)
MAISSLSPARPDRYYLPDRADWDAASAVTGEILADIRPAATVVFCDLLDPRMKIEIEVTARIRS